MKELERNLFEIVSQVGSPPEGVSTETYVIAETDVSELNPAVKEATPSYEGWDYLRRENPDLYKQLSEASPAVLKFGEKIQERQLSLSRGRRLAATVLAGFALAVGMGGLTYEAKQSIGNNSPAVKDESPIYESAVVGAAAGVLGAVSTNFLAMFFAGRLARKPAQKIVRRAAQKSA